MFKEKDGVTKSSLDKSQENIQIPDRILRYRRRFLRTGQSLELFVSQVYL